MTITEVCAAIRDVVEARPFEYAESNDPFDFDLQPDAALDGAYRIESRLVRQEGYLGPATAEIWAVTLWLCRRVHGDPRGTYATLQTDITSLTSALSDRGRNLGSFNFDHEGGTAEITPPSDADCYVASLEATVDFDRAF